MRLRSETRTTWMTKGLTSLYNKYIPATLAAWVENPQHHQEAFAFANKVLTSPKGGDPKVFPCLSAIRCFSDIFCREPIANEQDLRDQQKIAITSYTKAIVQELAKDPRSSREFALADGVDFHNTPNLLLDLRL